MVMLDKRNIVFCYDATASNYADKFLDELSKKHLDRILLQAFATENAGKGRMVDLGCGPGQTTRFLFECGVNDIVGTDLSPNMVEVAKGSHPSIAFEVADMLQLQYADGSVGSAIAFYSIVHFDYELVKVAFKEVYRILVSGGQFLFSFHVGSETIHLDSFLEKDVKIDFYFLEVEKIREMLGEVGFEVIDCIQREPYKDVEHPSSRAYVWVRK
jgi:ubiquinone/menaquinone biosynthesis C-methylase UbiE